MRLLLRMGLVALPAQSTYVGHCSHCRSGQRSRPHICMKGCAECSKQASRRLQCVHAMHALKQNVFARISAVMQIAARPVPDTLNDSTKDGDIGTVTAWSARRTASSDAPAQEARCWSTSLCMPAHSIFLHVKQRLRGCQDSRDMQQLKIMKLNPPSASLSPLGHT